ncbi:MAG: MoxR family ATPase [Planctomycetes bacterium]|nr:MoxR family ATPase [Planctomycetota bacterium]
MDPNAGAPAGAHEAIERVRREVAKAVVGQDAAVELALATLLAGGHALLEGVPGVAKTLLARAVARSLDLTFRRVQFTPDLMPSDVTGTNVFRMGTSDFVFVPGPVFTHILLADEINRTPPKTQSALLEAMQERCVTLDGVAHALSEFFTVFATQNPIEFEGTYVLPEAQRDRFLVRIRVDYPSAADEDAILARYDRGERLESPEAVGVSAVLSADGLRALRAEASAVRSEDGVRGYIRRLSEATRRHEWVLVGASPRASIALLTLAKALARIAGRDFITPDDVQRAASPVLEHRLVLRPEAEIEGVTAAEIVRSVIADTEVPR